MKEDEKKIHNKRHVYGQTVGINTILQIQSPHLFP